MLTGKAAITIIDDDDAVRDSMLALLESHGHAVKGYVSAEDFLTRSTGGADCLLVDHHMPGMTGLDLLEHLRAKSDGTPALIITARLVPDMEPRANRIGVSILQKPLADEELVRWIEEARTKRCPAQSEPGASARQNTSAS